MFNPHVQTFHLSSLSLLLAQSLIFSIYIHYPVTPPFFVS